MSATIADQLSASDIESLQQPPVAELREYPLRELAVAPAVRIGVVVFLLAVAFAPWTVGKVYAPMWAAISGVFAEDTPVLMFCVAVMGNVLALSAVGLLGYLSFICLGSSLRKSQSAHSRAGLLSAFQRTYAEAIARQLRRPCATDEPVDIASLRATAHFDAYNDAARQLRDGGYEDRRAAVFLAYVSTVLAVILVYSQVSVLAALPVPVFGVLLAGSLLATAWGLAIDWAARAHLDAQLCPGQGTSKPGLGTESYAFLVLGAVILSQLYWGPPTPETTYENSQAVAQIHRQDLLSQCQQRRSQDRLTTGDERLCAWLDKAPEEFEAAVSDKTGVRAVALPVALQISHEARVRSRDFARRTLIRINTPNNSSLPNGSYVVRQ